MVVPKNIQFSRQIKSGAQLKEFNFRKRSTLTATEYSIDVSDERGNRFSFTMQLREGHWKIQESSVLPWIREAETLLSTEIEQQESLTVK
jgi:hypothetical protein